MNRDETLSELRAEEDDLQDEVDRLYDLLREVEEETPEWYDLVQELSGEENQLAYVRACIRDYE